MNPLLVFGLLSMMKTGRKAAQRKQRRAKWPAQHEAPAIPEMPALPEMPHERKTKAKRKGKHKRKPTPAEQAHTTDVVSETQTHVTEESAHEDSGDHLADIADQLKSAAEHVQAHDDEPVVTEQPVPKHRPKRRPRGRHKRGHVTTMPTQVITSEQPVADTGGRSVADIQAILRGLGWTGHLTTKGSVQNILRDGLFGPATHDDWQQSANKRRLDPTMERTGPDTARVSVDTYNALKAIAKPGVSGSVYIPR